MIYLLAAVKECLKTGELYDYHFNTKLLLDVVKNVLIIFISRLKLLAFYHIQLKFNQIWDRANLCTHSISM